MRAVGEVLLRRLEYVAARLDEASEAAWIQFCEIVAIASLLHQEGHVWDEIMRAALALETKVVKERAGRAKGSCKMIA